MGVFSTTVLVVQVLAYGEPIDTRKFYDLGVLNVSACLYEASKRREEWEKIEHAEIIYIGCPGLKELNYEKSKTGKWYLWY